MAERQCKVCNRVLPLTKDYFRLQKVRKTEFYFRTECLECGRALSSKNSKSRWQSLDKAIKHKRNIRNYARSLGLDPNLIMKLWVEHDGHCDICGHVPGPEERRLALDHDHTTGEFRGWLCLNCNHLLGKAKDNIETLYSAISYLRGDSNG